MSPDLQTAFLLLAVGMITVFVILSLVVLTGRALIWVINNYFPVREEKMSFDYRAPFLEEELPVKKKLVAITAAIEIATGGKGRIEKIERV